MAGVALPDRSVTPGAVIAGATRAIVCVSGYSATVRDVSTSTRAAVYAGYGISYPQPAGAYEVDHLIPLELRGSNSMANLWPEPRGAAGAGFPTKDKLENTLHSLVCSGTLTLANARAAIATNWPVAYRRYAAPIAAHAAPRAVAPRPPAPAVPGHPAGATALCNDGTYSYALHHQGSCSHHGGVAIFYS